MSRNFELLQAAGNADLFLSTPERGASAIATPIAEGPVPTADNPREQRSDKTYGNGLRPTNDDPITDVASGSAASPGWFASVRGNQAASEERSSF